MAKRKKKQDYVLLGIILALLCAGLLVMYSASTVESFKNYGNTSHYFFHQLIFGTGIGLVGMYICSKIDYHVWQKYTPFIVLGSLILLALVKFPGVGFSAGGATRWIHLGPAVFQPAELAKIAIVLYISAWVSKRNQKITDFYYGLFPALIIVGLYSLLILWQPDVGSMLAIVITALCMLFAGGTKLKHLFWVIFGGLAALGVIVKLEPYRVRRFTTFLNPSFDKLGISYQINQALLAIGSGGIFGYGYGYSRQKHNYLPEPIGDSIFAVMAEELGFARVLVVLFLFAAFCIKGLRVAAGAPDLFGKMLGIGLTVGITTQALINIGSILGLLPLTGIPLPFFSYGSSSLIATLVACGILLNIASYSK
jgi:cell division protein FtsW